MIAIVCIDDNGGMMFNNRRQSRDSILIDKIAEITKGSKLWLNKYSYSLFEDKNMSNINVDESFVLEAANGEYCFVENVSLKGYEKWIEKLIVFKWNRIYPKDFEFELDLSEWKLAESSEFKGSSHDKITMEVYAR